MRIMAEESDWISLQRREKWCRQLVCIIKQAHSVSKIIGFLGEHSSNGLGIDKHDDLVLYKVAQIFGQKNGLLCGSLPPEYTISNDTNIEQLWNLISISSGFSFGVSTVTGNSMLERFSARMLAAIHLLT